MFQTWRLSFDDNRHDMRLLMLFINLINVNINYTIQYILTSINFIKLFKANVNVNFKMAHNLCILMFFNVVFKA